MASEEIEQGVDIVGLGPLAPAFGSDDLRGEVHFRQTQWGFGIVKQEGSDQCFHAVAGEGGLPESIEAGAPASTHPESSV